MATAFSLHGIRRVDFTFVPRATLAVQAHPGSAWRGAFGHALKRMVCAMRLRPCEGCPLAGVCIHPAFFGADSAAEAGRPYILCPDRAPRDGLIRPGQAFRVRLTLLPSAESAAAYAVRALLEAAAAGVSARRVPLDCRAIADAGTGQPIDPGGSLPPPEAIHCPPPPARVRLRMTTPLRIRLGGDLLTGRTLLPGHLVGAALRRLRILGLPASPALADAARAEAATLRFEQPRLGWVETTRFSSRQNSAMQMGGIVGEALLDLERARHVWPLLWAASVLHLGKGASMGFGRIEAAAA
ncbi:hypothetical protein GCM10010964_00120 [Caldovatus sediminis]|uniref:CRISPR-associated protein Cas6 C-terminal domain-containing protein n=1 Tax=Caldovatus sediminis TaxID=2041189 RepID=A0A8J2Z7K5_9PROT|nr:CRISPR system precrRNA processing endoribonuclease RAMP protein Cas6 [Caldovatus sediminis]GGG15801.1 hypothetical protein GCM10010964_00120 [Caldovatus sediminis]